MSMDPFTETAVLADKTYKAELAGRTFVHLIPRLVEAGVWFAVMPLPDNKFEVTVRDEPTAVNLVKMSVALKPPVDEDDEGIVMALDQLEEARHSLHAAYFMASASYTPAMSIHQASIDQSISRMTKELERALE